ncbi:MAG TPA: FxLYD domain-containing protein [Armatimonadota bacterium]|jgi:hypothetical protein
MNQIILSVCPCIVLVLTGILLLRQQRLFSIALYAVAVYCYVFFLSKLDWALAHEPVQFFYPIWLFVGLPCTIVIASLAALCVRALVLCWKKFHVVVSPKKLIAGKITCLVVVLTILTFQGGLYYLSVQRMRVGIELCGSCNYTLEGKILHTVASTPPRLRDFFLYDLAQENAAREYTPTAFAGFVHNNSDVEYHNVVAMITFQTSDHTIKRYAAMRKHLSRGEYWQFSIPFNGDLPQEALQDRIRDYRIVGVRGATK